jgi:CRP/FNR family transcriptional regulator
MTLETRLSQYGFSVADAARLSQMGRHVHLKAGTVVFRPGDPCNHYILPLSGALDVVILGPTGREMRLYGVRAGQVCIQTFSGLATGAAYSGEGRIIDDMDALMLSHGQFHSLMGDCEAFRGFVLNTVAQRFVELSQAVLNVASTPVPQRLAKWLLEHAQTGRIKTTQAALAVDISSAREVVSRTLSRWVKAKIVRVERAEIDIIDQERLRQIAHIERDVVTYAPIDRA